MTDPEQDDPRIKAIANAVVEILHASGTPPAEAGVGRTRVAVGWTVDHFTNLIAVGTLALIFGTLIVRGINPVTVPDTLIAKYRETQERSRLVNDHIALGDDLLDVGQPEAAKQEFAAALDLDGSNKEASLGLFKTKLFEPVGQGDSDPAVNERRLLHLVNAYPEDSHAQAYYADALATAGDWDSAFTHYTEARRLNPRNVSAIEGQGVVRDVQNQSTAALAYYETAERLSPNTQTFVNNVAYQLFRLGRYDEAITKYRRLLAADPRFLLSYFVLAQAQRIEGKVTDATLTASTLSRLLADDRVVGLRRNVGWWFFHTDPPDARPHRQTSAVFLTTLAEKRAYAHLSAAVTYDIADRPDRAAREVHTALAGGLGRDQITVILRIVRAELASMYDQHHEWRAALMRFAQHLPFAQRLLFLLPAARWR